MNSLPRFSSLVAIVFSLCAGPAAAGGIDLTSGTAGSFTGVPQSFNETRGVDVTVLPGPAVTVAAMRLDALFGGGAISAFVGARIYDSTSQALLASGDVTITSGNSATVPISMILVPGSSYRVS